MDRLPSERSGPGVPPPPPLRAIFEDAVRYWEPRRLGYNLALSAQAVFWVVRTWPHFRPAFTLQPLPPLAVLAALANVCYCAVYAAEVLVQSTAVREIWRRRRWTLWLAGTLLALAFEYYWIGDEIYPYVG